MDNDSDAPSETGHAAPMPKHIPFPEIPSSSELLNELVMFLFILFGAGMQFLHIYRTVWWIPDSHTNHTINYYLIEPYLVIFTVIILSRRLLYCLMNKCLDIFYNDRQLRSYKMVAKYIFSAVLLLILGLCIVKVYTRQNYLSLFLLMYPLVVYSLIFGFQVEPFFRTSCEVEGSYLNGLPMHCCSSSPVTIRDEVESLKNDFNNRFKQVIFTSVVNAYYGGFVPCFYAQNFIHYNVLWASQHIIFIWLGGFTMCTVFCFPAKYSDILHRSALHLGLWCRLDGRSSANSQPSIWSKTSAWSNASIVRYTGDLYKSLGPVTTALPGNTSHYRFFKLFNNPSAIYMALSCMQVFLVLFQILVLWFAIEWHHVLSLSFLALTNHFTLFKILRDYLITKKVYAAESSISEKMNAHYN
ncbi:transmembrane protein 39A [Episyrphus balteatus]|uniref:transmembrane protein 39A n=1 Tax=Episyrphus balteatus TaxID=286459 RepID=UPI002484D814|nr:transmembrane protein 39A [Episyrphus balteatus]